MGNTIKNKIVFRTGIFLVLVVTILISVWIAFPYTKKFLTSYSIGYYHYTPTSPSVLSALPATGTPALAVPMLMYHGVIADLDSANTTIPNFIAQMEMLKTEGYTTISVNELDMSRQGLFTLPEKPIIITFDDGRKDSFYTTDDILKKLGFTATLFEASGPTLRGNPFYLTFDELKKVQATGRWEIEAHGRNSHDKIQIVPDNSVEGRFLTSKIYNTKKKRLETTEEFEKRVEQDYVDGIQDLKKYLGIDAHYFAIPLNDYGERPVSNYPEATAFNSGIIQKYFKMAFIQANDTDDVRNIYLPVYNFPDENPYLVRRIEVKNMSADFLKMTLEKELPANPVLNLTTDNFLTTKYDVDNYSGTASATSSGIDIKAQNPDDIGQLIYGEKYWKDYSATVVMKRVVGRSQSVLFYFVDSKNYMSFGNTDNGIFLRRTVNGVTRDLQKAYVPETPYTENVTFKIVTEDTTVTCFVNGKVIYSIHTLPFKSGKIGVRFWDDKVAAEGLVHSIVVKPI
jgi:peptidoglycan/xylan/chitin deacetylase (PgdA/CDA1 family)